MEEYGHIYEIGGELVMGYSDNIHFAPTETAYLFQTLRIVRIKRGGVDWQIGNGLFSLGEGDIVLFNNIVPRKIVRLHGNGPLNYDLFGFSPALFSDPIVPRLYYGKQNRIIRGESEGAEKIRFLLDELRAELVLDNKYKYGVVGSLLHLILIHAARLVKLSDEAAPGRGDTQAAVARATQYIQTHLSEKLDLSLLAGMCGYSGEHFSRSFKKYVGTSVNAYIANVRIENALRLIAQGRDSVLSAALQSGFNTSSGFYKAFKRHKQTSPLKLGARKPI